MSDICRYILIDCYLPFLVEKLFFMVKQRISVSEILITKQKQTKTTLNSFFFSFCYFRFSCGISFYWAIQTQVSFPCKQARYERTGYLWNIKCGHGPTFASQLVLSPSAQLWFGWLHLECCRFPQKEVWQDGQDLVPFSFV